MMEDTTDQGDYAVAFFRESHPLHYLAVICKKGAWNLYSCLFHRSKKHVVENPCLQCSSIESHHSVSWNAKLSILLLKFLLLLDKPVAFLGNCIEAYLNYLLINGGFFRTLHKAIFDRGSLVRPPIDQFYSFIGFLDLRQELRRECAKESREIKTETETETETENKESDSSDPLNGELSLRDAADLCVMAAKLAYENEHVIARIVNDSWKMHLVKFYDCWNEYLQCDTTQAFLASDSKLGAKVVVLAFRGTSPFDVHDWCTDFDFSWYSVPPMGKVHVGFLEALGLGSRSKVETFEIAKQNASKKAGRTVSASTPASGLSGEIQNDSNKVLAFDAISKDLKELLRANLGARLYITGHSLGGALAVLFSAMLLLEKDYLILPSLEAIFTFGQPRVADDEFASYMETRIRGLKRAKYFRIVYGDDLVPRVPFDNSLFMFKHFGQCHFYRSIYEAKIMHDEPGKNLFILFYPSSYIYAIRELCHTIYLQLFKRGEYRETGLSMLFRAIGLLSPGVAAHNPANYVNAIKFGPSPFALQIEKPTEGTGQLDDDANGSSKRAGSLFRALRKRVSLPEW